MKRFSNKNLLDVSRSPIDLHLIFEKLGVKIKFEKDKKLNLANSIFETVKL